MKKITFHYFATSKLISMRFGTPVAHVGVEFEDGTFYESDMLKGNIRIHNVRLGHKPKYSVTIEVPEDKYLLARAEAERIYGSHYDYLAIVGFFFGFKLQDDKAYFCSELGRCVFEAATGVIVPQARLCTPYDLYLMTATYVRT
ncbi:hypothetical protein [Vibrio phage vB_pir03]|nr:hypothetical protein [Vibrio phage vB_pir03]